MPDEALTAEYVCDNIWVVGSPDTVAEKLETLYNDVGGFGTVLQIQYTMSRSKNGKTIWSCSPNR